MKPTLDRARFGGPTDEIREPGRENDAALHVIRKRGAGSGPVQTCLSTLCDDAPQGVLRLMPQQPDCEQHQLRSINLGAPVVDKMADPPRRPGRHSGDAHWDDRRVVSAIGGGDRHLRIRSKL